MLDSPEKYKKGVAFYAARSTFFLPEEEMTEEELLELIDFREKIIVWRKSQKRSRRATMNM